MGRCWSCGHTRRPRCTAAWSGRPALCFHPVQASKKPATTSAMLLLPWRRKGRCFSEKWSCSTSLGLPLETPATVETRELRLLLWFSLPRTWSAQLARLDADKYETDEELKKIREARGYSYMDFCQVCPEKLPNYDEKIKYFYEEHLHTVKRSATV